MLTTCAMCYTIKFRPNYVCNNLATGKMQPKNGCQNLAQHLFMRNFVQLEPPLVPSHSISKFECHQNENLCEDVKFNLV